MKYPNTRVSGAPEEEQRREGSTADTQQALLQMHLAAAVPLEIAYLKTHGGVTPEMRRAAQQWRKDTRDGLFADESVFHSLCGTKDQIARLTECLAILAFEDGGIRAFGSTFTA